MPRKTKTSATQKASNGNAETPPQPSVPPANEVRKIAKKRKGAAPKSTGGAGAQAPPKDSATSPSDEEIRTRAYFIAERRVQLGLAGSEAEDWIEAKRQLESEAGGGGGPLA